MDGKVTIWLSRFAKSTAETYQFHFDRWMKWMRENGGDLASLSPSELVAYQEEATNSEKYKILDLIQSHARGIPGRYNYKMKPYMAVRSFFKHSRAPLPQDGFTPRAEVPPVMGDLTLEEVKLIVLSSNPMYRAVFLCILQGGMDLGGVCDWSNAGFRDLSRALPELMHMRREERVLKIVLPGRKKFRNIKPFYTRIGSDAIDALETWVKRRPAEAEAIFTNQHGGPLNEGAIKAYWMRKLMRLAIIEPGEAGNKGNRYGKNLHELRDVFRSQWEKSPAKGSVAEFMLGHQVDPLEYNKAFRDETWTLGEYRKALPMLQIISSGVPFGQVPAEALRRELEGRDREIDDLNRKVEAVNSETKKEIRELNELVVDLLEEIGGHPERLSRLAQRRDARAD